MSAILELPGVRERLHRMSVVEYHRLGELGIIAEKVELLRGLIVDKMSKSPLHEFVLQKLATLLMRMVPKDYVVRLGAPLTFADSEPEPDISVVRGSPEDWLHEHPRRAELVVEISISSLVLDQTKAELYAEAGIPEYWLVRAENRMVDVYREPGSNGYSSHVRLAEKEVLRALGIPNLELRAMDFLPAPGK